MTVRTVTETLGRDVVFDGPVSEVIESLQDFQSQCPVAFRDSLYVTVESDYDSSSGYAVVSYQRPMTEEELRNAEARDALYNKRAKEIRRRQYEAMKKEFEDE